MPEVKKRMSIDFDLKFQELTDINPSFASAKIAICYPGRNKNKSDISKSVLTNAFNSLKNCPVVGRYDAEKDDFGGHDVRIKQQKDTGEWVAENATVPFGTVPESSNIEFQEVTEDDGTVHEYLFTDVILWKRQPGFECIAKNNKLGHSMEILVNSYVIDSDGYCVIEDMDFEALCILGTGVTPCFESSNIEMANTYAIDNFKSQFNEMLSELKNITATNSNINVEANKNEGGNNLDKFNNILQEFGLTIEQIDFEIKEDMTEDEFRSKAAIIADKQKETNAFSVIEQKYATYRQKREALENALRAIEYKENKDGVYSSTYYYLIDFDEKYVLFERYYYSCDTETRDYGRFAYTYDDVEAKAIITSEFEKMIQTWLTVDENARLELSRSAFELMQTEYETYRKEHSYSNVEYDTLNNYKIEKEKVEHEQTIDELLNEFSDLNDYTEFADLKERAYNYQIDDLRNECYIIRGKNVKQITKNDKSTFTKLPVEQREDAEPYGGIFNVYKKKNN